MSGRVENSASSTGTKQAALFSLDALGDGIIALAPDGSIVSANKEASRMLRFGKNTDLGDLGSITKDKDGWRAVRAAVMAGRSGDFAVQAAEGQPLMATTRPALGSSEIRWIVLRDIEAFAYRQNKIFNPTHEGTNRFMSSEGTRPDFQVQRQLCPEINRLLNRGERATRQGARILITGEPGVGKTEIARFLHNSVSDSRDPFYLVNCASAGEAELSEMLFGALGDRAQGFLGQTNGGTVFLDEVAELPPAVQVRLVGYLEDRKRRHEFQPASLHRQSRIIAATNRNLKELVAKGQFRSDLYFRLAVIDLKIPPLRDLAPLVNHLVDRFVRTINQRRHTPVIVPKRIREILTDYSFPGNIRELHNIIQRIAVFIEDADGLDEIMGDLLSPMSIQSDSAMQELSGAATLDLRSEVRRFERALIDKAIQVHGSKRKAAKALGVDIGTVVRKTAPTTQAPSSKQSSDWETKV